MVAAQVLPLALRVLLIQLPLPALGVQQGFPPVGATRDAMLIMQMGVYLMYKNQTPRHLLLNPALQLVWLLAIQLQVWSTVLSASVVMLLLMEAFSRTPIQNAQFPALETAMKNAAPVTGCPSMLGERCKRSNPQARRPPTFQALGPIKVA